MKTKQGTKVTANMLHEPEILKEMFESDEALRFLQPIPGTPSFWQSVQKDLFAMLRQLGIPTCFAHSLRLNSDGMKLLMSYCISKVMTEKWMS